MSDSDQAVERSSVQLPPSANLVEQVAEKVGIPAQKAERAVEIIQQSYSGPVPLPDHVAALNLISPDLGTELVRDYLSHRKHERELETANEKNAADLANRDLDQRATSLKQRSWGLGLGFIAFLALLVCSLWCAIHQMPWLAGCFLAPSVIGTIAIFVHGGQQAKKPERRGDPS